MSLRARLGWLIIAVMIAVLLPMAVLSYHRTLQEMNELSDGRLAQSARTLDVLIRHAGIDALRGDGIDSNTRVPVVGTHGHRCPIQGTSCEPEVGFQVVDATGKIKLATTNFATPSLPSRASNTFEDIQVDGEVWRMFTLREAAGNLTIRVGERQDSRQEIEQTLKAQYVIPLALGLPLLALLMAWAVRHGLRPLEALARILKRREPGDRTPMTLQPAPRELQPVLSGLNTMLDRSVDALERERRFSADVAHELRTPLAATMLHMENALATGDPRFVSPSFVSAQHGLTELSRRVDQLLALARVEAGAASEGSTKVDLVAMTTGVIEELAPQIEVSGVELSLVGGSTALYVNGYEVALIALLRNLIENALRHVSVGGQVVVCLTRGAQAILIDVMDDGPGIPLERRAAVFARFHRESSGRGDGYGLGLSIVQRAAQLHGASIELLDSAFDHGLLVRVSIPVPQAEGSS
ncbi:ATP-binding protein [Rhodanobacter thiooxydans]|nr:ATP-binding protein [Rhodanobacter thiooxydans]